MHYSVVVPAHDEGGNLEKLIDNIVRILKRDKQSFEVIVVNDNSSDNSSLVLKKLQKRHRELGVITRRSNPGVGNAIREGFARAKGEIIITMDGDLSHDPCELPKLINKMDRYDIVCGSRYINGGRAEMSVSRRIISRGANFLVRTSMGIRIKDITSGYRAIKRQVLNKIEIGSGGFGVYIEIPLKADILGFKIGEVPIICYKRGSGESKLNYIKEGLGYFRAWLNVLIIKIKLASK